MDGNGEKEYIVLLGKRYPIRVCQPKPSINETDMKFLAQKAQEVKVNVSNDEGTGDNEDKENDTHTFESNSKDPHVDDKQADQTEAPQQSCQIENEDNAGMVVDHEETENTDQENRGKLPSYQNSQEENAATEPCTSHSSQQSTDTTQPEVALPNETSPPTSQDLQPPPYDPNLREGEIQVGEEMMDRILESAVSNVSVSHELDILAYSRTEWKGNTYKAKLMCEGYKELTKQLDCSLLRRIRGDNYCALRSVAFHLLTQADSLELFRSQSQDPVEYVKNSVERMIKELDCVLLLQQWNFANRIPLSAGEDKVKVAEHCVCRLAEQLYKFRNLPSLAERQQSAVEFFNAENGAEVYVFEALKLMMLETAIRMYKMHILEEEVPTYVWLLFARDSSEDPQKLLLNHLNAAGDSGGLEQIEMFLLGHSLEVTIRVARPLNVHQEDFVTFYPDHVDFWDKIDLIAEDDRHYNIATT